MMPTVRLWTIGGEAKQTGKSWEEVAKEKMKSDFICFVSVDVIFLAAYLVFNYC